VKVTALALAIAILAAAGCERGNAEPRPQSPAPAVAGEARKPVESPTPPEGFESRVGFHSSRQLTEHFEKHGGEFGSISRAEYLARAQQLRDAALDANILEAVRRDGVITRFDRSTGAFIAFDHDRTIRTFFRPNDGEAYFRRQARR